MEQGSTQEFPMGLAVWAVQATDDISVLRHVLLLKAEKRVLRN